MSSKASKIIVLLLFISAVGGFDLMRISAQGSPNNYFNQNLRYKFARYPITRQLLHLKDFGDDRYDYLGPSKTKIVMEVYETNGFQIDRQVLDALADDIYRVTGKPTSYEISENFLPRTPSIDENQIPDLFNNNVVPGKDSNTAYLYILSLTEETGQPNLLGSTYNADTILFFNTALQDFTGNEPSTFADYQLSTALHEFGHQLGLDHNDKPGCLMNAKAEDSSDSRYSSGLVDFFCSYELDQIKNMRY